MSTKSIIASCTTDCPPYLLIHIPGLRQDHKPPLSSAYSIRVKATRVPFSEGHLPAATLPSTSPRGNPHKHLLLPDSYSEREHKRIKQSEIEISSKAKDQVSSNMSSEEDYDDFVYDDEDDGFDQDVMDAGMFSDLWALVVQAS